MASQLTAVSYLAGAGAYALAILFASSLQGRNKVALLFACWITLAWLSVVGIASLTTGSDAVLERSAAVLEQMRSGAWIVVGMSFLLSICDRRDQRILMVGCGAVAVIAMAYAAIVATVDVSGLVASDTASRSVYLGYMAEAIAALLLVENIFRNSSQESRWAVKHLCFGLAVIFCYDFVVYAQAGLMGRVDPSFFVARGAVQAIAMPLIMLSAMRLKGIAVNVRLSRAFVFHSATLLLTGAYLVAAAAAAYWLRALGGAWSSVSQVSFLMLALLLLAAVLSSGQVQARTRGFINQNFFTYKYDYRLEWARFIDGISNGAAGQPIPERIVLALANIIGSTGGKIWVRREEDQVFRVAGAWNMGEVGAEVSMTDRWIAALEASPDVLSFPADKTSGGNSGRPDHPPWLTSGRAGLLAIPLVHANHLVAFAVLGELRAPRKFNWEDFQLLKIAARQAASYIAEDNAAQAIAQARQFEEFHRRFAFIVHDIKNLAAQMSLILRNAKHYGGNPEFQKDLLQTVGDSAARLQGMLARLKNPSVVAAANAPIELTGLLRDLAATWKGQSSGLRSRLPEEAVHILGGVDQLRAIVNHLVQNAIEAAGEKGQVAIDLNIERDLPAKEPSGHREGECWAMISVTDDGPGMEEGFIRKHLFQPLHSTKPLGLGMGAYQARQLAREMGGRLEVKSQLGVGTQVVVRIPCIDDASGAAHPRRGTGHDKSPSILRMARI